MNEGTVPQSAFLQSFDEATDLGIFVPDLGVVERRETAHESAVHVDSVPKRKLDPSNLRRPLGQLFAKDWRNRRQVHSLLGCSGRLIRDRGGRWSE